MKNNQSRRFLLSPQSSALSPDFSGRRPRLVLAVLLLATLAAWGAAAADPVDDDTIYDRVRQRLYNDPDVKGYNIGIQVRDGVVTLTGTVASEKIRSKAEKISRKVSGVKQVINKLQVGEEKPNAERGVRSAEFKKLYSEVRIPNSALPYPLAAIPSDFIFR